MAGAWIEERESLAGVQEEEQLTLRERREPRVESSPCSGRNGGLDETVEPVGRDLVPGQNLSDVLQQLVACA